MAFTFDPGVIIDPTTFSYLIYDSADGSTGLTPTQQLQVEIVVNAVNSQILNYINRNLIADNYIERWDSIGSDEILTKEYPINSVASIKISNTNDFTGAIIIDPNWYTPQKESIVFNGNVLPIGRACVEVVYNAGYALANIPKHLILAIVEQFKTTWARLNVGTIDAPTNYEHVSKMGESFTVSRKVSENGLSPQVIQILSNEKRLDAPLSKMFARIRG